MHKECFTVKGWKILADLVPTLAKHKAILAGGTALALQLGHRISVDLDFFTNSDFRVDDILTAIKKAGYGYEILSEGENHIVTIIDGVKFSLFHYEYPFIETLIYEGTNIASMLDIAAMKVIAIIQRGSKRDFIDLYRILQDTPFTKIVVRMVKKFGAERVSPIVIGKSLMYFTDADQNTDPEYIGHKIDWDVVKRYFKDHARQFMLDIEQELKNS